MTELELINERVNDYVYNNKRGRIVIYGTFGFIDGNPHQVKEKEKWEELALKKSIEIVRNQRHSPGTRVKFSHANDVDPFIAFGEKLNFFPPEGWVDTVRGYSSNNASFSDFLLVENWYVGRTSRRGESGINKWLLEKI